MPDVVPEAAEALDCTQEAEQQDDDGYVRLLPKDSFGIDIDAEFKGFTAEDGTVRGARKPANWQRAVDLASEVLVSEMRTLLETGGWCKYHARTQERRILRTVNACSLSPAGYTTTTCT